MKNGLFAGILALVFIIPIACNYNSSTQQDAKNKDDVAILPLNIVKDSIVLWHPDCKDKKSPENCTYISFNKVEIKTVNDSTLEDLSKAINNAIIDIISSNIVEKSFTDIDSISKVFFDDWSEYNTAMQPRKAFAWKISISGNGETVGDSLLSYHIQSYSFTGGAHGYAYTHYLTYNLHTQEAVDPLAGVDTVSFLNVAEQFFRKAVGISASADLEAEGFFFNQGKFHLPAEIGLNKDGYVLYYNDYEIRPHSEGPLKLVVPYEAVELLLQSN